MKKIILLFIVLLSNFLMAQNLRDVAPPTLPNVIDFVVTASPNNSYTNGDRFDFDFKIQGDYGIGNEIRLEVYHGNISNPTLPLNNSDLIAISLWESNVYLNFPTFTNKEWWNHVGIGWQGRSFSIPNNDFTLKVTFQGNSKILHYTAPDIDSDGDGILDSEDDCPFQPGPSSNNGCPLDDDGDGILNSEDICPEIYGNASNFGCPGNPDLVIRDDSEIASPGWGTGTIDEITNSNRIPLARYGGFINLYILLVKNIGNGNAYTGSLKIRFYISMDTNISSNDFGFSNETILFTPPLSGQTSPYVGSGKLQAKLYGSTVGNNLSYGNYNLIIMIDEENDLEGSESNRDNNKYIIPITYVQNTQPINPPQNQYNLDIYDFSGSLIQSSKVQSQSEENLLIRDLPSGYYIIKSQSGVRKIYK